MDEKKSTRLRRLTALCLGVVFLLVVVAATVYSQTGYVERLPLVTLAPIDWMVVPNEALYVNDDGGYRLYYVEQEDGPWGKRYILREWVVTGQRPDDGNHTVVYEIEELPYPVITSLSAASGVGLEIGAALCCAFLALMAGGILCFLRRYVTARFGPGCGCGQSC